MEGAVAVSEGVLVEWVVKEEGGSHEMLVLTSSFVWDTWKLALVLREIRNDSEGKLDLSKVHSPFQT